MKTKIKLEKTSRKGYQVPWTKMFLTAKMAREVEQETQEILDSIK